MFSKPENISVDIPIKPCNAYGTTLQFFNPSNLSSVHNRSLLIHPEWLNGFNAAFKKSIGCNKKIYCNFGVNTTGLYGVQCGFDYFENNTINFIQKWPTIRFGLNTYEKSAKLFISYQPLSSFRLQFKNQIFAPKIGQFGDEHLLSSISSIGALYADWFGNSSKLSFFAISSNEQSIAANLSFSMKVTSNFVWGAELNYNQNIQQKHSPLEPCLTAAYLKQNIKLAASVWPNSPKIHLSCFKRIAKHFQSGSIFIVDVPGDMTSGTVFCQYELDDSIIRAKIASNGLIGATYGIKLWNFSITNSIMTNIYTKKIIYGMKIGMEF